MKYEIYRKSIHLFGFFITVFYYFTDQKTVIISLLTLLSIVLLLDYIRIHYNFFDTNIIKKIHLSTILRDHEQKNFSALTLALIALSICAIFSPEPVFNLAVLILIFADTAAAFVGKFYGKHKISNKSIEGSAAFFITSVASSTAITFVYNQDTRFLLSAIIASSITTLVELFSKNAYIDDNFSIPISCCIIMYLLG